MNYKITNNLETSYRIKKKKTKLVDLPMNVRVPQLTKEEINISIENKINWSFLILFLYKSPRCLKRN